MKDTKEKNITQEQSKPNRDIMGCNVIIGSQMHKEMIAREERFEKKLKIAKADNEHTGN